MLQPFKNNLYHELVLLKNSTHFVGIQIIYLYLCKTIAIVIRMIQKL